MKDKDIFHECVCTGQKMTWEEWSRWISTHSSNEVVHRCGEFEYNINDVCLNPHRAIEFKDKSKNRFGIQTCQVDSAKWRRKSIEALGNAWVPQVAYEIFEAIEKIEANDTTNNKR